MITLGRFAVEIRDNCNAIYEVGLYAAAVWAYPAPWHARLGGTLMGASVLYGVNLLRIGTLLTVGVLLPAWFEVLHLYVWQTLFLLVVAACWVVWVSGRRGVLCYSSLSSANIFLTSSADTPHYLLPGACLSSARGCLMQTVIIYGRIALC